VPPRKGTNEEFIRIWQESETANEVAKKMGMHHSSVGTRAARLRARGVPLKYMIGISDEEAGRLAELARSLGPGSRK
jgi:hypothetical protein